MSSVNQATLLGRVGQEPKTATAQSGNTIARLTLATSRKVNGEDKVQWHNITCFGKAAEFAGKYIHKGDCILVIGEISYEKFKNNEGKEVSLTSILASNIQLCASKNGGSKPCENDLPSDF